jgi:hypothetical protein
MMDLRSQVQILLQEANYETWLASVNTRAVIGFEDDTVMGFAYIFETVESLLEHWREVESASLTANAPSLQKAGDKTWNVYSIFLCSENGDHIQTRRVRWIEEDLERTRKIAACGVTDSEGLVVALLPLLPLQYQPVLDSENFDLTQRFSKRVSDIAPDALTATLDENIPAAEVVRLLGPEK